MDFVKFCVLMRPPMAAKQPAPNILDTLDNAELDEVPSAPKKPRRGRPPGGGGKKKSGKPSPAFTCFASHTISLQ